MAVFNVEKAVDENGVPITPVEEYTSNIVRYVFSEREVMRLLNRVQASEAFPVQHHPAFAGRCRCNPAAGLVHKVA